MRPMLLGLVLVACATTNPPPPKGGPRGLYASDHIALAREQDEMASRQRMSPDVTPSGQDPEHGVWYRSWDTEEHARLAEAHRAQATQLVEDYQQLCAEFSPADASVSPLKRYAIGGWNTATGAIMYLAPNAGEPDRLLALMKCHRAWMRLAPAGMEDCPLDLPGLVMDARGDPAGVTVALTVRDAKLVGELQRRVAVELETSALLARPTP